MPYGKPAPGMPVVPYVGNLPLWSDIIDMLAWWKQNQAGTAFSGYGKCLPIGENLTGVDMQEGQLVQIDGTYQPGPATLPIDNMKYAPILKLVTPVWNSKMDNLLILHKPIPKSTYNHVFGPTILPAQGVIGKTSDRWCMPDPSNPQRLKSADAGIFRVITMLEDYASSTVWFIVDTTKAQPLWRYELFSEWVMGSTVPGAVAYLKRIDGDDFSYPSLVNLIDPDNLMSDTGVGDWGYCVHNGNYFVAVQAPCIE